MIIATNNWGASGAAREAQRTDLWQLDLKPVVDLVAEPDGVQTTPEYNDLAANVVNWNANNYAYQITLPESLVAGIGIISGTQGQQFPGYDLPQSGMRVDFYHDAIGDSEQTATRSRIYSLLWCWHLLAMAGQSRYGRVILPLLRSDSKVPFRQTLELQLLRGSESGVDLEVASRYSIVDCWVSDVQHGDLDTSSSASLFSITATIQAASIVPIDY